MGINDRAGGMRMRTATVGAVLAVLGLLLTRCGSPSAAPAAPEPEGVEVLGAGIDRVESAVTDEQIGRIGPRQAKPSR